jgi:hypothetical protein
MCYYAKFQWRIKQDVWRNGIFVFKQLFKETKNTLAFVSCWAVVVYNGYSAAILFTFFTKYITNAHRR